MSNLGSGNAFNALGQILSEGGDVSLANAISRESTRHELLIIARWQQMGASDSDVGFVRDISEQAVEAGRTLTRMDPDEQIPYGIIPINPQLFGETPGGLRFYASTDYQLSSTGLWYRADFKLPDLLTTQEIIAEMFSEAERRSSQSPGKFGTSGEVASNISGFKIQTIIARF